MFIKLPEKFRDFFNWDSSMSCYPVNVDRSIAFTIKQLKINSFWLLYYNTDQPARHNRDPHQDSRVMEVWFDDIVIATEYIGPIHGKPKSGKKKAVP